MIFFKVADGPEIHIHDGANEPGGLAAIGEWLNQCHKDATDATAGVRRVELDTDCLRFLFKDSVPFDEAKARALYAWKFILRFYLPEVECFEMNSGAVLWHRSESLETADATS